MFSILDDNFFFRSFLLIGEYLKYVLLIVPVGFFINQISNENFDFNMIYFIYFVVYMVSIMLLANYYDEIGNKLDIKNPKYKARMIFHKLSFTHSIDDIFKITIFCFIMTFGVFMDSYWNLFALFFYLYVLALMKVDIFNSILMYLIVCLFCVMASIFYIAYGSIFLYIFFLFKKLNDGDSMGSMSEFEMRI